MSTGVTYGEWDEKSGECDKKCVDGSGAITIERTCLPENKCRGAVVEKEEMDCTKYCSSGNVCGHSVSMETLWGAIKGGKLLPFQATTSLHFTSCTWPTELAKR